MRLFAAALALFGLVGSAYAQSAEVLTYSVGDTWTYANGGIRRVTSVSPDGHTVAGFVGGCPTCLQHYDKTLRLVKVTATDGGAPNWAALGFMPLGPDWKLMDFPLTPKQTWRVSAKALFRGNLVPATVDVTVVGYEEITTKAGTFKAYKIQHNWSVTFGGEGAGMRTWTSTGWFSPEVKWFVKLISTAPNAPELELVSYNLK